MEKEFFAKIKPQQLSVYLTMAIMYAKRCNAELPIAEELNKKLMRVTWDDDAELLIVEKPF